ncbi:MAG: tagatose 1,6-diphosphate aldolase [Elusimicrobia bacterium]|nr:tagatose 1,6-diphosphate aldolase [Candidatus Obscuribacterium magneticum]
MSTAARDHFLRLTPGKLMGLKGVTDTEGRFKVLALDQSNSFRKFLKKQYTRLGRNTDPTFEEIRDAKLEITTVLSPSSSAVLLDVNYGARQCINSGALPKGVGLIVRSEASRDAGLPGEMEPGWSIEKIKKMGGTAVKLLVYMDVEDKKATDGQMKFVDYVAGECKKYDILLMIEELSYPRAGETKESDTYKKRLANNIFKSAELLNPYADVLKLEFPADIKSDPTSLVKENLSKVNEIAERPWVLLSAGVKFDLFEKQVELTMQAGCSGTMAGRAIFQEYFDKDTPEERTQFLKTTGVERMNRLNVLVDKYAQPWFKRYGLTDADLAAAVDPHWYMEGEKVAAASGTTAGAY